MNYIPHIMALGVGVGYLWDVSFLKGFILPLTFLMVYPMMVTLQMQKILTGGKAKLQIVTQLINFSIIPFVAYGLGKVFFHDKPLIALGLLLAALLPTSGMTISWTGIAKGNVHAAIQMTVLGLIIGSIATPFYIQLLTGAQISVPFMEIWTQIAVVVFLPLVVGYGTQRLLIWKYGEELFSKDIKKRFPGISTIGVLGVVFVAMALKSRSIITHPELLISLIFPLLLLYGINFILSTIVAKIFFSRADGIALVYGTVMRNLSIALAIAMTAFGKQGSDIALIIALAYIIQVQSAAVYVKYTDRIFGKAEKSV